MNVDVLYTYADVFFNAGAFALEKKRLLRTLLSRLRINPQVVIRGSKTQAISAGE